VEAVGDEVAGVEVGVLFDIGGNRSLSDCRRILTEQGTLVVVGGPAGKRLAPATRLFQTVVMSPFVSQRLTAFISEDDAAGLAQLKELAESGKIRPVIDRRYALSEAVEAIRHVGEGRARGKVVFGVR
jgi:NADPH:quinone reductase-like Zn-dependent oxidoreductase